MAVCGYFAKRHFENRLQAKTEEFKAGLQVVAKAREIRFTKLHEKRLEVIARMYYLIEEANLKMEYLYLWAELDKLGDQQAQAVTAACKRRIRQLREFAMKHRI
jgi:hypothetical protein